MPYASRFCDTAARLFPLFTTFLLGPIRPSPDDRMGKHGARFCVGPTAPSLMAWTSPFCCSAKGVYDENYVCLAG